VLWEHLRCGRHSGIRSCCIAWYVTGWQHLVCGRWWTYQPYWRAIELSQGLHGRRFDHVPCPLCLALGRVVELRDCDCQA